MTGKTVLVAGAGGGIGRETALALARMGATVVISARDLARAQPVVDEVLQAGGRAEPLALDVASLAGVRGAARQLVAAHPALDVLVNNAGILTRRREVTPEGFERMWVTNFLGHFLLTLLLLPALCRGTSPRVVNVSSAGHRNGRMHWEDLELARGFHPFTAYAQSKLAQVLFTRELARREPGIATNALHPGGVYTGIYRVLLRPILWYLRLRYGTPADGAAPVVRLAMAPDLEGVSGRFFDRSQEVEPSAAARNGADARRLWDLAERAANVGSGKG
jgi:NAD(P)-dependent dehydrogenase (short-subunit alcohol dehydrogenase family)